MGSSYPGMIQRDAGIFHLWLCHILQLASKAPVLSFSLAGKEKEQGDNLRRRFTGAIPHLPSVG